MISTTLHLEHEDLPLTRVIRSVPEASIRVVPDASTDPNHDAHHFRFSAPDFDAVEAIMEADHTVSEFRMTSETMTGRIYTIEYTSQVVLVTPTVVEVEGLVVTSRSHEGGWELQLQLGGYDALYELRDHIENHGFQYDIAEIRQTSGSELRSDDDPTQAQLEALVCAYRNGYFNDPREASLEDLAAILDISQAAVSGRLKRGCERVVRKTLIENDAS